MRRELPINKCSNGPIKRINSMNADSCGDFMIKSGLGLTMRTTTNGLFMNTTDAADALKIGFISLYAWSNAITSTAADIYNVSLISGQQNPNDLMEAFNVGGTATDNGEVHIYEDGFLNIEYNFIADYDDFARKPYCYIAINGTVKAITGNMSGLVTLLVKKDDIITMQLKTNSSNNNVEAAAFYLTMINEPEVP